MTAVVNRQADGTETLSDRPYLIVSGDSHAGPSLEHQLRDYCPKSHLEEFDEYVRQVRAGEAKVGVGRRLTQDKADTSKMSKETRESGLEILSRIRKNPGSMHADARLKDMDEDGVTCELIFAGAQNAETLPWSGGLNVGDPTVDGNLRALGFEMWNRWLADFISAAPERLLGVSQTPIWDIEKAVETVHYAKEHGLRAINLPAPRADYLPYFYEEHYEPFWAAVEECDLPLVTHSASGGESLSPEGRGIMLVWLSEVLWLSRRGLGHMIFGGVFDRHPNLRVAFVEQRGNWVQQALAELDSAYLGAPVNAALPLLGVDVDAPKRKPSEYWRTNCFLADSFMAPYEAAMRDEIGIETMMWGSDYPHLEGTWPRTNQALRNTFGGIPEADTRAILGDNGVRCLSLDVEKLQPIVDRIGPKPKELFDGLPDDEMPPYRGLAFREGGSFH